VLKNVSEIQDSDSAGVPANVANNAVAIICIEALRTVIESVPVKTPINSQVNSPKNLKKKTPNKSQQINVNSPVKPLVILKKTSPIPPKDKQIELIKKNLSDKIQNLDELNDRGIIIIIIIIIYF
jgi:hypothetical protein